MYPQLAAAERKQTSIQRGADLKDLGTYGQGYRDQFGRLSSAYAGLDGAAAEASRPSDLLYQLNDTALNLGDSELRAELERSALAELRLGGGLSAEQERGAAQASRGAWSSRGLAYSNPAVADEILSRDSYMQAMQDKRRGYAGNIWQIGSQEDQANRGFGLNVQGLNAADRGNRLNSMIAASQAQLAPIQGAMTRTASNPYALLSSFQAPTMQSASAVMSGAPQVTGAAQSIQPLYNYGKDVFDTNFNAAESRANSSANAYAQAGAGLMSTGGSMYGSSMRTGAPASGANAIGEYQYATGTVPRATYAGA